MLANLNGVEIVSPDGSGDGNSVKKCAAAGSRLKVERDDPKSKNLHFRFLQIASKDDNIKDDAAIAECKSADTANTYTAYQVDREYFKSIPWKRTGVTFGALVVPFKFRLGSAKELVSSATIAPFVGFRTGYVPFGVELTPVVAAGLSVVPVTNTSTSSTESKAAYTFAAGFRATSAKNEQFNAGLLFGRDFLNKSDRLNDPNVTKPWISFYLGYSI